VTHLPRLRSALPTRRGREATPGLPGFTYITLIIDVPASEDHGVLNLPLGCLRLPTKVSFKYSQYARRYNRQARDTSGSHWDRKISKAFIVSDGVSLSEVEFTE
jgi:hypothetical protein